MDFEETRLYYSHQQLHQQQPNQQNDATTETVTPQTIHNNNEDYDDSQVPVQAVRRHFREFLRNYRLGNISRYIYREKLLRMHRRLQHNQNQLVTMTSMNGNNNNNNNNNSNAMGNVNTAKIEIDMAHIGEYDPSLLGYLLNFPAKTLPCFETAAVDALSTLLYDEQKSSDNGNDDNETTQNNNNDNDLIDDPTNNNNNRNGLNSNDNDSIMLLSGLQIQVLLKGKLKPTPLRSIKSEHMNRLLRCPGIVISTTPVKIRAVKLTVRCPKCNDTQQVIATDGPFNSIRLPRQCYGSNNGPDKPCGNYPYITVPDESIFVDQQTLKLQEAPERVPTGEMPRSVLLAVERSLVDIAPPGTRVSLLCVPTLFTNSSGTTTKNNTSVISKAIYLRVVGFQKDNDAHGEAVTFTPSEVEAFTALAKRHDVYDILYRSIAPNIQGDYTIDVKKALVCQLMSGTAKKLSDGVRLRGDINILLLGDPSMAKSQFLKFISKVAPVGIYTSGKGSSAAGLTASVVRDAKGEFYLEGGAMVLADGGIVCIDEFDKMRNNDRVAIHEAMEQQTISIAKAGITTVLNSRSSVLAAANPVYGRYDDYKSASDNIDLMSTILSRFDMIFLLRDIRDEERDKLICQHVMGVHINNSSGSTKNNNRNNELFGHARPSATGNNNGKSNDNDATYVATHNSSSILNNDDEEYDDFGSNSNSSPDAISDTIMKVATTGQGELGAPAMKKYIQYCKAKCIPRLSEEAGEVLTSSYVKIRDEVRKNSISSNLNNNNNSSTSMSADTQPVIPITVRQLEALVRISESLAKMRIDSIVRIVDVTEALRLFKVSTMAASSIDQQNHNSMGNSASSNSNINSSTNRDEMDRTESFLRNRLTIGNNSLNRLKVIEEGTSQGYNAINIAKCISIMASRGEILERNQGRLIKRIK